MIIDGKKLASDILSDVQTKTENMSRTCTVRAVVLEPSPATESYLATKSARAHEAGMVLEVVRVPDGGETHDVLEAVSRPGADAIIVQLPLPERIDTVEVLNSIPLSRDADVLSAAAYDRFRNGEPGALIPPVASAVSEILSLAGVEVAGKRAVVIGNGRLVGEPCSTWLRQQGADVSTITRESGDLLLLKEADIVVSGAGSPALIQPEHLRQGVVLIDAGTSESGGAIVGDAEPACASVASVFTPVPGGVGPVAVACLFKNALVLSAFDG